MIRLVLLASLVATGCLTSDSSIEEEESFVPPGCGSPSTHESAPLAQTTYYTGFPAQYASPAECLAHSTHPFQWDCSFEIALCHNGKAGLRFGDIVTSGTYAVDVGGIARGLIETDLLALDVVTGAEPENPIIDGIRWQIDTESRWTTQTFDVIACD